MTIGEQDQEILGGYGSRRLFNRLKQSRLGWSTGVWALLALIGCGQSSTNPQNAFLSLLLDNQTLCEQTVRSFQQEWETAALKNAEDANRYPRGSDLARLDFDLARGLAFADSLEDDLHELESQYGSSNLTREAAEMIQQQQEYCGLPLSEELHLKDLRKKISSLELNLKRLGRSLEDANSLSSADREAAYSTMGARIEEIESLARAQLNGVRDTRLSLVQQSAEQFAQGASEEAVEKARQADEEQEILAALPEIEPAEEESKEAAPSLDIRSGSPFSTRDQNLPKWYQQFERAAQGLSQSRLKYVKARRSNDMTALKAECNYFVQASPNLAKRMPSSRHQNLRIHMERIVTHTAKAAQACRRGNYQSVDRELSGVRRAFLEIDRFVKKNS